MAGATTTAAGRQGAPRGQWLTIAIILVALAGIVVSLELVHVHFKVNTDPDFVSFCNMGEAVNCETVAASSWSEFLGVPVAVWAIFAYAVLFGLALAGTRRVSGDAGYKGFPGLIFLWSLAGAAVTIGMGYISTALIASFCLLCAGLYVLNTAVFVLAVLLARRAAGGLGRAVAGDLRRMLAAPVTAAATLLLLLAVTVGLILFYPDVHATVTESPAEAPAGAAKDTCDQAGRTDEGFPLFGAPEGLVTIEEFSDYECGHCKKAHDLVRKLVHEFHGKVRLVHRHFPLDMACNPRVPRPFHANACLASKAAICADRQERFWDYNDRLFADQKRLEKKHILQIARELGLDLTAFEACLLDPKTDAELRRDIRDGIGWDVRGTPSFIINGEFVKGARNEEGFRQLIQQALARCEQPAQPAAPATTTP